MNEIQAITTEEETDQLTGTIIGAAIEVHRNLGPGLLESVYEICLAYELTLRNLKVDRQQLLPIVYKGVKLDCDYRLDLLVEDEVIIEIKSVKDLYHVLINSQSRLGQCFLGGRRNHLKAS